MWPKNNKESFRISLFNGGRVTKTSPSELLPNQSPDCQNVKFDTVGYVQTENGYQAYNSAVIAASAPIQGLAVHKANATAAEYMVIGCSGSMWRTTSTPPASGTVSAITGGTSIFDSNLDIHMTPFKNELYMSDGTAYGYRYTGSSIYQAGVRASTQSAASVGSVFSTASGHSAGVYSYVLTGTNENSSEGGYTYLGSTTLTDSTKCINVSNIPVYPASANVSSRSIYVKGPSSLVYYYHGTIADNTTTTYTDSSGASTTQISSSLGPMPPHKFMVEYLGFLFCAGDTSYPTRLYYSVSGYSELWPPANYLEIGENDQYPISGLRVYNGSIVIHKNDGYGNGCIYILYVPSTTVSEWQVTKTSSQYGSLSNKAIVEQGNKMVFPGKQGIYNFSQNFIAENPQFTTLGAVAVDSMAWPIEPDITALNEANLYKSAAIEYKNKLIFAFSDEHAYNDVLYTYDHSTVSLSGQTMGAWNKHTAPYVNCFCVYKGFLFGGSATTGTVHQLFVDDVWTHDGAAIDSYYTTPYLYGNEGHRDYTKTWREAVIGIETVGNWNLSFDYRGDPSLGWTSNNIDLSPASTSLWGSFVWGRDVWGQSGLRKYVKITITGTNSDMIQFRFRTNTAGQYFKIFDLKVYYNVRGQRQ